MHDLKVGERWFGPDDRWITITSVNTLCDEVYYAYDKPDNSAQQLVTSFVSYFKFGAWVDEKIPKTEQSELQFGQQWMCRLGDGACLVLPHSVAPLVGEILPCRF